MGCVKLDWREGQTSGGPVLGRASFGEAIACHWACGRTPADDQRHRPAGFAHDDQPRASRYPSRGNTVAGRGTQLVQTTGNLHH